VSTTILRFQHGSHQPTSPREDIKKQWDPGNVTGISMVVLALVFGRLYF
jgi:hypothetical protein